MGRLSFDRNELVADVRAIAQTLGKPTTVLADNGYLNEDEVRALEGKGEQPEIEVLVSVHAEAKQLRRRHDFRPQPEQTRKPPEIRSEFVLEMKEKMSQDQARGKYRKRKQTVEPVFGTIKKWMGFTQFNLRGLANVTGEWNLVTLAYNVKRLRNLIQHRERETEKTQAIPKPQTLPQHVLQGIQKHHPAILGLRGIFMELSASRVQTALA